jgi:hypothetical protein
VQLAASATFVFLDDAEEARGYVPVMDVDESKNDQFLSVTRARAAYRNLQRQVGDALSMSDTQVKQSGRKIDVSGAAKGTPPQPTRHSKEPPTK